MINRQGYCILWYGAPWLVISIGCLAVPWLSNLPWRTFVSNGEQIPPKPMFEKAKTIAFTGNRKLTSKDGKSENEIKATLCNKLFEMLEREYLENGITTFISGMALGFDLLCAVVVAELKLKYPDIRLIAALPFIEQADKFPTEEKNQYKNLIDQADFTIAIGGYTFSNQAYHDRNDYMLANASKVIAYHNGKPRSGTGSTIRKAIEQGIEVVNLYDEI